MIAEAHVSGMKVDGAAFLVEEVPVIALTLLRDSLDNFWFTLMHEIAHVVLHYRTGLSSGFFDDFESTQIDEFEREANAFATNLLIPDEVWSQSAARISKSRSRYKSLPKLSKLTPRLFSVESEWSVKITLFFRTGSAEVRFASNFSRARYPHER